MPEIKRPLSPHLAVYSWQTSNTLSILHRMTGVALSFAALGLISWIVAVAAGEAAYNRVLSVLSSPLGYLVLFGFSASLFYHLGNGIRHLSWDAGLGFEKNFARLSGWFTLLIAVIATVLYWLGAFA
ncbi:MAG: succinate dehydrogenase, cytochrome b556 subunit [Gammaproteobacteria bacterium]|nr:succinate dehydrogenase, cytochrome b556 subunit [Gammaproteobacteria bacterium]MDP6615827.1 succinate dehydrogenase, cytochrome b556 subunit [Gammaproteobacteria bacterium]MDP6694355.1 succinate dehydrogenase, cytochrome b556 subunit [Gammaproteobacteria bacterium]